MKKLSWWHSFVTLLQVELQASNLHKPAYWLTLCVNPFTYFCLLALGLSGSLGGADYLVFVAPGIIVMHAVGGMTHMIYRTVIERRWGLAALKLQAGSPASAYLFSLLAPRVIVFIFQGLVIVVVATCFIGLSHAPKLLLAGGCAALCAVFWSLVGLLTTSFINDYQKRDFVVGVIVLPLTFAAPVFYSLENAPTFTRWVATVNPLNYQVQFIRGIAEGELHTASFSVTILTLIAVVTLALRGINQMRNLTFEG